MPPVHTEPDIAAAARTSGGSAVPGPSGRLAAVGRWCAVHRRLVVAAWVVLLVAGTVAMRWVGGVYSDDIELPDAPSHTGSTLLAAHEPAASGHPGSVVFHVSSGHLRDHRASVEKSVQALAALPHVRSASDPFAGGAAPGCAAAAAAPTTLVSTVHFDARPKTYGSSYVHDLDAAVAPARADGVEVEYGGGLDELTRPAASDRAAELVGIGVALLLLLAIFGSVLGAVLPLAGAVLTVVIGIDLLGLLARGVSFGTAAPTLAAMIGLGVGIDYALFLTTRFRQHLMDGATPVEAATATVATSGRSVLVAAVTVAVALLGLYASGIAFIGHLGLAAVVTVFTAALGAVTLVPALLTMAGHRIDRWSVRRPVAEDRHDEGSAGGGWVRYSRAVARNPWRYLALGLVVLAIATVPLASMRLGHVDDGADPSSFTDERAYALISDAYGPGANGTFTIVVDTRGVPAGGRAGLAATVQHDLAGLDDVAHASPLRPSPDGAILVGTVTPDTGPQDAATHTLYDVLTTTLPHTLEGTTATGYVTGATAMQYDFRDEVSAKLPLIIGVVVATAFLLVLAAFRGVLLAVKAALLNLLSIGAAYGVLVAVFQWGWGRGLLGLSEDVPIESYVPMMMFAIVFGLSMDYEVFLLSRVKEAYERSGDTTDAVATGLSATARVITAAALIMVSVFTSFAASPVVVVKMLAVGLAVSVLIDATVVRLLLVPATMSLLGRSAWWMPRRLDRLLPRTEPAASPAEAP